MPGPELPSTLHPTLQPVLRSVSYIATIRFQDPGFHQHCTSHCTHHTNIAGKRNTVSIIRNFPNPLQKLWFSPVSNFYPNNTGAFRGKLNRSTPETLSRPCHHTTLSPHHRYGCCGAGFCSVVFNPVPGRSQITFSHHDAQDQSEKKCLYTHQRQQVSLSSEYRAKQQTTKKT
ncbi:uncharacterized protein LALA0_S02e10638g [Lachancea lanzarotensis]|uniref:LALA0S02e10638g1_1 n=1 Tax=Lachancea lanzarotensis TaxID=1245769 RepID=A0A0C7MUP7_9SACH|nr:uncharacterized protein LALA0_S02e10638g [Lachancea lanzarotensis]CEP61271.1 LALA0S02e10638g1_1 [Lachancea lanzarotensis]